MSSWLLWIILSAVTGSPLMAAAILVVGGLVADRFTWGLLPDPSRWFKRWLRASHLERTLRQNAHDRRARLELADLCVGRGRYARAVELLRPNLEAGDSDTFTLFTMGIACLGAGHFAQGELFLDQAEAADPKFRRAAIDLERGRFRLRRGDGKGALAPLERLCAERQGSVEGRFLLARALEQSGDDGKGALLREEAWKEYRNAPRFQRRAERRWAWRAKPSKPLTVGFAALLVIFLLAKALGPSLSSWHQSTRPPDDIQ